MRKIHRTAWLTLVCVLYLGPFSAGFATADFKVKLLLNTIALPPGFSISIYTDQVPGARSLSMGPDGVLYVGTRQTGKVYAVVDNDRDGRAERVVTIAQGLDTPNGVAVKGGDLYVAEIHRILRYPEIAKRLGEPVVPQVIYDQFPRDRHHGWKFIRFGPDGRLYVPVGAPCNVCRRDNPVYATIARLNTDGSGFEVYAHGVRNSVGFDWHPFTGALWFTDNGRDWLGDDMPPDELNMADRQGMHFGFPFCHGAVIGDPEFGEQGTCGQYVPPAVELGAHVAALGMRFYAGTAFPQPYHNQIFIAEHGSWNRSRKSGYRITTVRTGNDGTLVYEPFAQGWRIGNTAWGRPVDVEITGDGAMLVSDDSNGVIYRIDYRGS